MLKFLLLEAPHFVGLTVCVSAGFAAACYLLEWSMDRLAKALNYSRLFLVFAVRRIRKAKGMPEPVFIEDCRSSVQVLVDYALAQGIAADGWEPTSIAVQSLRYQLAKEMPK